MSRILERLIKIDYLIRSPKKQTQVSLAHALEVSERTIRNDITFLRNRFHAPLAYSKTQGWHYQDSSWRLPSILLTQGELFALTLGARILELYSGSAYLKQLQSAIDLLAERLPDKLQIDLQTIATEKIQISAGAKIQLNPQIWQDLELASQESRQVWMKYYAASRDQESERTFDPYLIYICRGNPYVIGHCHLRSDIRWFRIDRIRQLKLTAIKFTQKKTFNAQEYLKSVFQYEVGKSAIQVKIYFDKKTAPFIRERQWHHSQRIQEQDDGSIIITLFVQGLNDIKRWLLNYGEGAIAIEPPELSEMLQKEMQATLAKYQEFEHLN